jgi:DNA-binding transcriptional MerR regulator
MPDLMTIGEVARQAHVATSAIRYYERRGLLSADARHSGQRRYRAQTLRQLVFIGMMQDIGLSLDDIQTILYAPSAGEWKAIARRRIDALDARITELRQARTLLAGVVLCPYDHPATDCEAMGNEIDRRLATPPPQTAHQQAGGT